MILASVVYLGGTVAMLLVFAVLVARTLSRKRKATLESPRFRMLEDD